jgi:osmotically-inducible protein OsmY
VTLSGRVKSKEEEAKAIEIARTISGVTDVKSSLQIEP